MSDPKMNWTGVWCRRSHHRTHRDHAQLNCFRTSHNKKQKGMPRLTPLYSSHLLNQLSICELVYLVLWNIVWTPIPGRFIPPSFPHWESINKRKVVTSRGNSRFFRRPHEKILVHASFLAMSHWPFLYSASRSVSRVTVQVHALNQDVICVGER